MALAACGSAFAACSKACLLKFKKRLVSFDVCVISCRLSNAACAINARDFCTSTSARCVRLRYMAVCPQNTEVIRH